MRTHGRLPLVGAIALVALTMGCASTTSDSTPSAGSSSAGSSSAIPSEEKVNIAFFGFAAANAYTQFAYKGAQAAAEANNATVTFYDGEFSGPTQATQVQDAVQSGKFQGMFILANDNPSMIPMIELAVSKGIKVTAGEYPISPDLDQLEPHVEGQTSFIGYQLTAETEATINLSIDACEEKVGEGEPCTIGIIPGARTTTFDAGRVKVAQELYAKYPNIELVIGADGGFTRDGGNKAAADLIQGNPDIDVIVGISADPMAVGAQQAVTDAGKVPGKDIYIIGLGASQTGVKAIREGLWYGDAVTQPYTIGMLGTEYAIKAARGETVPEYVDMLGYDPIGATVTTEVLVENPSFTGEWDG